MDTYIIKPSSRKDKKLQLITPAGKKISFGAKGYSDYTIHHDTARKDRYIQRHKKEDQLWSHTKQHLETPSYLSRYILWSEPDLKQAVSKVAKK